MSSRVARDAKLMSTLRAENSMPALEFPALSRTGCGAWYGYGYASTSWPWKYWPSTSKEPSSVHSRMTKSSHSWPNA